LHPASSVPNLSVTLGLRAVVVENGVRQIYSARYYNPATGRFMSRDPLDGNITDPKSLHKYLYADGDPVNGLDPTGRGAFIEYIVLIYHSVLEGYEFGTGMRQCVIDALDGDTTLLNAEVDGNAAQSSSLQIAINLEKCVGEKIYDLSKGVLWSAVSHHL